MAARNMLDESFNVDDEPEVEEPEAPEEAAAAEGDAEPGAQAKPTPISRRQRAADRHSELTAKLEAIAKLNESATERLERIERENAELRGHVQGLAQRPVQYAPPQERQPEPPDPDKLIEEANKLLDAKDFNGYQRKLLEAGSAKVMRDLGPRLQQQSAPAQPGVNPMLQMVASQYVDVMSDPDAFDHAQTVDRRLARAGVPEGPDRWKRAFEEGRRLKGGKEPSKMPTYDTKSRAALAGVPTSSNGAGSSRSGGGEPGVTLTETERKYARKFKMSDEQYAKHLAAMHPERVER